MMLNFLVMLAKTAPDGELNASAYIVLAGMFLIIVGGLSWCFYRALKANNKSETEQLPGDV